jgi:predicted anti-sigma-YlaC factor YlaD
VEHDKIRARLPAYKDNELEWNIREQISAHLQGCNACREELSAFDEIDSLFLDLPQISVSDTFVAEILTQILPTKSRSILRMWFHTRILEKFFRFADSVFELLPWHEFQKSGSLDEFGDFPPLSLSHAYFQLIGLPR